MIINLDAEEPSLNPIVQTTIKKKEKNQKHYSVYTSFQAQGKKNSHRLGIVSLHKSNVRKSLCIWSQGNGTNP